MNAPNFRTKIGKTRVVTVIVSHLEEVVTGIVDVDE